MNLQQDYLALLFNSSVLEEVRNQFMSDEKYISIDSEGMNYLLFKPTPYNINLEVQIHFKYHSQPTLGSGGVPIVREMVQLYSQPIGFFSKNTLTQEIDVTILKEFEKYDVFSVNKRIPKTNLQVKTLSLIENALIAAISAETEVRVQLVKDVSISYFSS
jgi:hypothetical protein